MELTWRWTHRTKGSSGGLAIEIPGGVRHWDMACFYTDHEESPSETPRISA